jgi:hypothetical protein
MEGVADVGSDDEFAVALDDAVPRVTLVIPRLLHCRRVGHIAWPCKTAADVARHRVVWGIITAVYGEAHTHATDMIVTAYVVHGFIFGVCRLRER